MAYPIDTVHPLDLPREVRVIRGGLRRVVPGSTPAETPGYLGNWTTAGFFICAECSQKLLYAGLWLPPDRVMVRAGEPIGVCVGHEPYTGPLARAAGVAAEGR